MNEKSIAFFGSEGSFNFHKIGGVDAFVRRLSIYLSEAEDFKVYLINYGATKEISETVSQNITIIKHNSFDSALEFIIEKEIKKVFICYLHRPDRKKIKTFKQKNPSIDISLLLTVFHNSFLKRNAAYLEASMNKSYKNIYGISERVTASLKNFSNKATLLLPPVDDSFFCKPQKRESGKFRISYMGRLDKGKGADIVIDFFKNNNLDKSQFEFYIYSYPWKNDQESMAMHNFLLGQNEITYIESKVNTYSSSVDEGLKKIIDDSHLFLLPYRTLSSTIDSPLVPLEILSRSKTFISTNQGIMSDLIADKNLMLQSFNAEKIEAKIIYAFNNYDKIIYAGTHIVQKLDYQTSSIARKLLATL